MALEVQVTFDCADPGPTSPVDRCKIVAYELEDDGSIDRSRGSASADLAFRTDNPVTVTVGNVTLNEGTGGNRAAVVPITLSRIMTVPVAVHVHTVNWVATAPGDFAAVARTVTIPAGALATSVSVPLVTDSIPEPNERFFLQGDTVSAGGAFAKASASVIIVNDD